MMLVSVISVIASMLAAVTSMREVMNVDYPYDPSLIVPMPIDDDGLRPVLAAFVPHYQTSDLLQTKKVSGGITNQLLLVRFSSNGPAVLVRIFGGEGLIDRDLEGKLLEVLEEQGIAPKVYGRFGNGRVEAFIENARDLKPKELPKWAPQIAESLKKIHAVQLPLDLGKRLDSQGLWATIDDWKESAKEFLKDDSACKVSAWRSEDRSESVKAFLRRIDGVVALLQKQVPTDAPKSLCHNDLLAGNIVLVGKKDEEAYIQIIDFEYGGINYRGFDIANHWCEYAGGTQIPEGTPDYSLLPDRNQRKTFINAYLGAGASAAAVEALTGEVEAFVSVDHIFWGLWAVGQAITEGCVDFDYLNYAYHRFQQYDVDAHSP